MAVLRIRTASGWEDVSVPTTLPDASVGLEKLSATGTRNATTYLRGDNTWATVATGAPSNMVTTDSTQTILVAGAKTFGPGALLMNNGSVTAEPYSDANPPATLNLTDQAAAPANPPTGQSTLYSPDGKSLRLRDTDGSEVLVGPSAGGSGGTSGAEYTLTTDYANTTPAAPTTGVTIFARHRARRLLASVGPTGLDTSYQPAIFSNRIARLQTLNANGTPQLDGMAVAGTTGATAANTTGAGTAQTVAATSFFNSMTRIRYATTAATGVAASLRSSTAQWHMSSTANKGGFFFVVRFGLGTVTATNRVFIGLSTTTTVLSPTTNPSAFLNMVGIACDSTHTTFRAMSNAGTAQTATHVDLGANFPTNVAATNFFEARLFAPSGGGQNVYWSMTRLNDGAVAQGQISTALPALDTLMSWHVWHSSGTTAAIASIDVQSVYIETDN